MLGSIDRLGPVLEGSMVLDWAFAVEIQSELDWRIIAPMSTHKSFLHSVAKFKLWGIHC